MTPETVITVMQQTLQVISILIAAILLPALFIGFVALCMGILNVLGHFAAPAFAPLFLNLSMIGVV